jgi:eukaryotic-like serine/threonine-protein kinase
MNTNLIGSVLLNQYRVDNFIAAGGMGAVYRVWDLKRDVPLAMKVLHADLAEDPVIFKRFQREANALKKLTHPNIVPFYGLFNSLDMAFLLEAFVDGPSLGDILRRYQGRPLPLNETLVFLKGLCAALGYAHANGVAHCDVKPGNVMVDRGGNIYLTDFGIARHTESTTTSMGGAGTPAYMAPEQIRGGAVSAATDVYALGVMLFEMLTGRRPFRGNEVGTENGGLTANERIRQAHLTLPPPDPRVINPEIPEGLSAVILKAMSKDPNGRYASTQSLFISACAAASVETATVAPRTFIQSGTAQPQTWGGTEQRAASIPAAAAAEVSLPASLPLQKKTGRLWVILCSAVLIFAGVIYLATRPKVAVNPGALPNQPQTGLALPAATTVQPAVQPGPTQAPATSVRETASATAPATVTQVAQFTIGSKKKNPADGLPMLYVPAGSFRMGEEAAIAFAECQKTYTCGMDWYENAQPVHTVELNAFWIYKTEVTNAAYLKCTQSGACDRASGTGASDSYPVTNVNWQDAANYCTWAGGRLPTEAEWEYAARGTDGRLYPWGNETATCSLASLGSCSGMTEVGSHTDGASFYGALDMAGNVWEWVSDWFGVAYYASSPRDNPQGPSTGAIRVKRGGSFTNVAGFMIASSRGMENPKNRTKFNGFRCVMDVTP